MMNQTQPNSAGEMQPAQETSGICECGRRFEHGGCQYCAPQKTLEDIFGPVIHAYARADALADGVLIDVSETAREAGITFPVAITAAAWADCVAWSEADTKAKSAGQSERGRLWDVVWMLRYAITSGRGGELIRYQLSRVPRPGCGAKRLVTLKAVCGPGDDAEPVITVMLPSED